MKIVPKNKFYKDLEVAKGRIFKWNYVVFVAKICIRKLFISNSKIFLMTLQTLGFKFLAKIMRSCVFCCSSFISCNTTNFNKIVNTKAAAQWADVFFRGKHLCWSLFLIKLLASNFPVNTVKFVRTAFFIKHLRWLLLKNS